MKAQPCRIHFNLIPLLVVLASRLNSSSPLFRSIWLVFRHFLSFVACVHNSHYQFSFYPALAGELAALTNFFIDGMCHQMLMAKNFN